MSIVSFKIKLDKADVRKQKVTVTSVAAVTTKLLFGICDCTVDSDVGKGEFSLVLGILHVCGLAHVRSQVSPALNCTI